MKHEAVVQAGIPVFPRMTEGFYLLVLLEKSLPLTEVELQILQSYVQYKCQDLANVSVAEFIKACGRPGENFAGREGFPTLSVWRVNQDAWMYEQYLWDGGFSRGPLPLQEVLLQHEGTHKEAWHDWRHQHTDLFGA